MFGDQLREMTRKAIEAEKEKTRREKFIKDEQQKIKTEILRAAFRGINFYEIPATHGESISLDFLEDPQYAELTFYEKDEDKKEIQDRIQTLKDTVKKFERYPDYKNRAKHGLKLMDDTIEVVIALREKYKKSRSDVYDFLTFNEYKILDILRHKDFTPQQTKKNIYDFLLAHPKTGGLIYEELFTTLSNELELNSQPYLTIRECEVETCLLEHKLENITCGSEKYVIEFTHNESLRSLIEEDESYRMGQTDRELALYNHKPFTGLSDYLLDKLEGEPGFLDFAALIFFESQEHSLLRPLEKIASAGGNSIEFELEGEAFFHLKLPSGGKFLCNLRIDWLQTVADALGLKLTMKGKAVVFSW